MQTMPAPAPGQAPQFTGALDCFYKTLKFEGVRLCSLLQKKTPKRPSVSRHFPRFVVFTRECFLPSLVSHQFTLLSLELMVEANVGYKAPQVRLFPPQCYRGLIQFSSFAFFR